MKKLLVLLLTAAMTVGVLGACAVAPAAPAASGTESAPAVAEAAGETVEAEAAEDVSYKDTIIIGTANDQNIMDGHNNNTNDVMLRAVYSQLVRKGADNKIEGDLAESWEVSEDSLTWTFHLRHGVKFQSGKELTAADVKASYDRLLGGEQRYSSTVSGYITGCNVVDDYTVELTTPTPIAPMLTNLCHRAHLILNADYIEKYGADLGTSVETTDGTGPYKLAKWDMDQEMVFERFDDYFRGPVPTKTININIIKDANARLVALESGAVDMTSVGTSDLATVEANPDLVVWKFDSIGTQGLQFNCANEYMADPRVRQAVSLAIDRQLIVDTLYSDIGEKACTCTVHPLIIGYNDLGVIKQDQEKAKELLAEAGYADGFDIIIMDSGYNKSLEACEMIVAMLAEVGIRAEIDTVDSATFRGSMGNRSFPGDNFKWALFYMGWGGAGDADEMRRVWTTSPDGNNNNNYGWYSNAEVDQLLADAAKEMDEAKRMDLYKRAEEILYIEDPAAIFMNDRFVFWCTTNKLEGLKVNVNSVIFWDELKVAE